MNVELGTNLVEILSSSAYKREFVKIDDASSDHHDNGSNNRLRQCAEKREHEQDGEQDHERGKESSRRRCGT